jgi:sterol desaturase/sphingolipid hydroxylase (fatty acid hydroxylase superfamily)
MFHHLFSAITGRVLSFNTFVVLLTWTTALAGAAITFTHRHGDGYPMTLGGFRRFLLPSILWKHRSPRLDIGYYFTQHLVSPLLTAPFLFASAAVAVLVVRALSFAFGANHHLDHSMKMWIVMLVVVGIVNDFGTFFSHYLCHKTKLLWQFHRTHHSTEFLIPLSNRRLHPLEETLDLTGTSSLNGLAMGILCYVLALPVENAVVAGLDVYFLMNLLSFYHLRHSHIDMSYGRLEKWIMSPAQHQVHHSQEVRHWDRNFGLVLSIWDRMFGTLLYAERYGTYRLGLPENGSNEFRTVPQLYLTPLRTSVPILRDYARAAFAPRRAPSAGEPALPASGHAD